MVDLNGYATGEIRAWQARRNENNKQLAAKMGRDQMWISRKLRGLIPLTLPEVQEFADALGIPVSKLLPNMEPSGYRAARTAARSAA